MSWRRLQLQCFTMNINQYNVLKIAWFYDQNSLRSTVNPAINFYYHHKAYLGYSSNIPFDPFCTCLSLCTLEAVKHAAKQKEKKCRLTNLQRRNLLHRVNLAILVAVLLAAWLDQADRFDVVRDLLQVQRYPDAPRAGTPPVRVQDGLRFGESNKCVISGWHLDRDWLGDWFWANI